MSHIAIDAREWSTSTGRYISSLIKQLELIDLVNHYSILMKPADMDKWQPSNASFQKIACPYKEFSLSEQLGFRRQLDRLGADLVHFAMTQQPMLYRGKTVTTINDLTTLRFKNPLKNRLVYSIKQFVYGRLKRRVARKSTAVITYSQFVKDDIVDYAGIDPQKVTAIPLAAFPITEKPDPLSGLIGKHFVLYVGRPAPHKNLERLIEAFGLLKSQHPELTLVLAGKKDANYERIETQVRQRAIKGVVFTGHVSEGRLRWLFENCTAYVFPSLSEGFGLPGLEAMQQGAPVVSSNATCLPEIYGEAAKYFDPTDTEAMAAAIDAVLSNETLRKELIQKGRARAAKYSWQHTAEQTLEIYQQALDQDGRGAKDKTAPA